MNEETDDRRQGRFQGMVEEKLTAMEAGLKAVESSVTLLGEKNGTRLGDAERKIGELNGKMEIVVMIGKWIFGPMFGSMGLGLLGVVAWWFLHK